MCHILETYTSLVTIGKKSLIYNKYKYVKSTIKINKNSYLFKFNVWVSDGLWKTCHFVSSRIFHVVSRLCKEKQNTALKFPSIVYIQWVYTIEVHSTLTQQYNGGVSSHFGRREAFSNIWLNLRKGIFRQYYFVLINVALHVCKCTSDASTMTPDQTAPAV